MYAYAGCMSTVSRGTSMQASSRSDEAPVNELTFNESERVASGLSAARNWRAERGRGRGDLVLAALLSSSYLLLLNYRTLSYSVPLVHIVLFVVQWFFLWINGCANF